MKGLIDLSVRHTYDDFVGKVAEHRERAVEEIDRAAQGRVWIGTDALDRGLVDRLGSLRGRDRVGCGARRVSRAAATCSTTSSSSSALRSA